MAGITDDRTFKVIVTLLIAFTVTGSAITGFCWFVNYRYHTTLTSVYDFRITVTADSTLRDLTIFFPLPTDINGTSPIVESLGRMSDDPAGCSCELIGAGESTFLKVTAPAIDPEFRSLSSGAIENGSRVLAGDNRTEIVPWALNIQVEVDDLIDTVEPVILLRPRADETTVACMRADPGEKATSCREYTGYIYACYETGASTSVDIEINFSGKNSWYITGWRGNEFHDTQTLHLTGPVKGWFGTDGHLTAGIGEYSII